MMLRITRRLSILSAIAAILGLAGCDRGADAAAVPTAPSLSTSGSIRLIKGASGTGSLSAVIDENGGEVRAYGHVLTVPAGAVTAPTRFTATLYSDGYLTVKLRATQQINGQTVRVGTADDPFKKPLVLRLSYERATDKFDPRRLLIVYLKNDTPSGALEALSSTVDDSSKTVITQINHFSRYAIGEN